MCSRITTTRTATRVLVAASLLVFLCTGCGSTSGASIPNNQSRAGLSPTQATANPSSIPTSSMRRAFDIAGLHIDTTSPACAINTLNFGFLGSNLVLSKDPQSYDVGQIQQIADYVSALINGKSAQSLSTPPEGLLRLQGSLPHRPGLCVMELMITNIGERAVQLLSINLRLVAAPQVNTASYRLIDACSLVSPSERGGCPPSPGFVPELSYRFELRNAPKDTIFTGMPVLFGTEQSTQPILDPGQLANVTLFFESTGSPDNFVYAAKPELTINSAEGGMRKLDLQQLTDKVYFADQEQFSCYTLQGSVFVPVSNPATGGGGRWCL